MQSEKIHVETLLISLKDALKERSSDYSGSPASYFDNYFCRVPGDWTEGNRLKENYLEKIFEEIYGQNWRSEDDGLQFVIKYLNTTILPPRMVKKIKWSITKNNQENHFWFYIAAESGEVKQISATEFKADVNSSFQDKKDSLPETDADLETFSVLNLDNPERLTEFIQYFDSFYGGKVNKNFTEYVYGLVEKHLAKAGLTSWRSRFDGIPTSWANACWHFTRGSMYHVVHKEEYNSIARDMLKELVDFCLFIPNDNAALRIAEMLKFYLEDFVLPAEVESLLPDKAKAELPEMRKVFAEWKEDHERWEEEKLRLDQMGY